MTKEISLSMLLKVLKSAWWKILIITVVVAVAVAAFTEFVIPKKYQSSVEFYVINTQTNAEYVQSSLLAASERLANDYIKVINSDRVVNMIIEDLEAAGYSNVTPKNVRNMLSSSIATSSSTFSITVTTKDPDLSYRVANLIETKAPQIMREVTRPEFSANYYKKTMQNGQEVFELIDASDLDCVSPIRSATVAKTHSSPSLLTYTFLAAVVAAFLTYCVALLIKISDTTIRSESGVKDLLDPSIIIIGTVPQWHDIVDKKTEGGKAE